MADQADMTVQLPAEAAEIPVPPRPVVVVGAGVIGAACASALAEAGCRVLLIDRARFGRGCSEANCGYVSPSHILPLCKPGAIGMALRSMFQRDSPFHVRPRLDMRSWKWFWTFARHCTQSHMLHAGAALHALLQSSRKLYDQLLANGGLTDCEWETLGLLFVYGTPSHFDEYSHTDELLRREYGVGASRIERDALLDLEPALSSAATGAWKYDCDAHLRPEKLMQAWGRRLVDQRVCIREDCELVSLEHSDPGVSAIITTTGRIEVDQVVIAAGAWTRMLRRHLHVPVPIEPGKGYSLTCAPPPDGPRFPIILEEERVALTPMQSGLRVGSTMEFAGFDKSIRQHRLNILTRGANKYLKKPLFGPFEKTWFGWRPMSADGIPLIGQVPRLDNVWLAAGHSMLGVSMATGTGKLLAELLTRQTPHIDPHPYRIDRF